MAFVRLCSALLGLPLLAMHAQQPSSPLTANQIMARVAANQDRSEAARAHFVYVQHASVASRKGSTVRCEEITDTRITPTPTGSEQQLLKLDGRLLHKGRYIAYNHLGAGNVSDHVTVDDDSKDSLKQVDEDDNTDLDLVENMRSNLLGNKSEHTKDGINAGLFPLTSKSQPEYQFKLLGREPRNGHDTFHITFSPKDKSDFLWKGDAWIDTASFEPVVIRTAMSRNIPLAVRLMLGTNVPGLGFTIIYAPQPDAPQPESQSKSQPDAVWFPVSFGSEFKIHVLFLFSRQIVISAENRDFEKTHVTSIILGSSAPPASTPHP
ncbi:MAG TPA: hypothetical protein VHY48_11935 [Acidobacteriaceae bacterium]|jgi:hypothetical protein|nr:hypothetical protein [Acidobacteriaceae bacterium]